jgi:hypothetical protein
MISSISSRFGAASNNRRTPERRTESAQEFYHATPSIASKRIGHFCDSLGAGFRISFGHCNDARSANTAQLAGAIEERTRP